MKKAIALRILVIVLLLGAFFWLAPANTKDKVIGLITFATNERQCFNSHKESFIDPDSAYVDSSYIWTKKEELETLNELMSPLFQNYEAVIRVKAFAKNRMGAYVPSYVECPLADGAMP